MFSTYITSESMRIKHERLCVKNEPALMVMTKIKNTKREMKMVQ